MPVNDLYGFEIALPNPGMDNSADGVVEAPAATWAEAVARLWLTPPPRVIVAVKGGESFRVLGGEGLAMRIVQPLGTQQVRSEVYRFAPDRSFEALPAGLYWSPADAFLSVPNRFDCALVSGQSPFTTSPSNPTTFLPFSSNREPNTRSSLTVDDLWSM